MRLFLVSVLIIVLMTAGLKCVNKTPQKPTPAVQPRVMLFSEGQLVKTVVGNNIVQVIEADTFRCFGGACPKGNDRPKIYLVRMPSGNTEVFKEYELKAK